MKKAAFLLALVAVWPACAPAAEEKPKLIESWRVTKGGHKVHEWKKPNGTLIRAETDMNDDGKVDRIQVNDNHGTTIDFVEDRDRDGILDQWLYYHCTGEVFRIAEDTNKDGLPDVYETYLRLNRDKVIHEWDRNFDKKIDRRAYQVRDPKTPRRSNKSKNKKKWVYRDRTVDHQIVWEERDDDFDGVIDAYTNLENPDKKKIGHKIETKATVPNRFENLAGNSRQNSVNLVSRMNERYEMAERVEDD